MGSRIQKPLNTNIPQQSENIVPASQAQAVKENQSNLPTARSNNITSQVQVYNICCFAKKTENYSLEYSKK